MARRKINKVKQRMTTKAYLETAAHAAECFRLAVPLMTRQPTRPHPLSYALWYEHVSGRNQSLSAELDRLLASGTPLDEAITQRLYREHVLDKEGQSTIQLADGFRGMLDEVGASARLAGEQSATFEEALGRWQQAVEAGEGTDPARCAAIQADTQVMRASVLALQNSMEQTRGEVDRLKQELARVHEEALRDSLTGLANRRAFDRCLAESFDAPAPACLLVADIDHFKKVNDTYGHLFGDQVLRVVAEAIRSCLAPGHLAARTGGEEFAVLLPGASLSTSQLLAEKIRTTVAGSRIRRRGEGEAIGTITISLGLSPQRAGDSPDSWFERADQALYAAKHAGRNRVTVAA
jgi:diguanylate cyclase